MKYEVEIVKLPVNLIIVDDGRDWKFEIEGEVTKYFVKCTETDAAKFNVLKELEIIKF